MLPPLQTVQRGGWINTLSGCRMSKWYYIGNESIHRHHKLLDCKAAPAEGSLTDPKQVKQNDTIYVTFTELQQFVDTVLDEIEVDIVVISGQDQHVDPVANETISKLLSSRNVMHWFCQNLPIYGGSNLYHEKLSPFPYGLRGHLGSASVYSSITSYHWYSDDFVTNKSRFIYAGPIGVKHNPNRLKDLVITRGYLLLIFSRTLQVHAMCYHRVETDLTAIVTTRQWQ